MAKASDDSWLQADEEGFPLYFQKYVKSPHTDWFGTKSYWVLWDADDEEPEHPTGFSLSSLELKEKFKVLLKIFMDWNASRPSCLLIQFWEPVLIEGRTLLTTRHQPFAINAINSIHQGLCRYRIISELYEVYVDEWHNKDQLGYLGRVFIHKLPEFSPNIQYYTVKEYPLRQHALACQITAVNAYPVLDPSGQSCIGVLEVAWSPETASIAYNHPYYSLSFPKEVDLKILDLGTHYYWRIGDDYGAIEAASKEMREVLDEVCEAHKLDLAQTWAVCGDCMLNASYTGQPISTFGLPSHTKPFTYYNFQSIYKALHLREGQGVVGQALSSHGLIFCPDITQFSIVDYPLAHFAKFYGLSSCFAICLQSSRTGSRVYVLEFFLPLSPIVNESVINLLRNILGTMKLHFQTFKPASGKDWGEKLPIQFVDYHNGEKYSSIMEVESQITTSPQGPPGTLQDEGRIVKQDPSSQQSKDNVANAEQSNINCTFSRGSDTSKNLERSQSKTGIQLDLNDILPHAIKKVADVAIKKIADAVEAFDVSRSTLKLIYREHNMNWRPPRNIKENCSLSQADDDGQPILHSSYAMPFSSNQVLPTIAPTNSHVKITSDLNFVDVKAKYRGDIIKFKLLLSSGLAELQNEIAKRLKLMGGTYEIKYEDEENDLVLITCDEDVQFWMRTCGSQGSNSLKIFLLPK